MPDPLDPFDRLRGGLDLHPVPPAEIRRRGDRLRRRRTALGAAGAAAAVVLVVTPVAWLGTRHDSAPDPLLTPTPTVATAPIRIPADFPLAVGLPATKDYRVTGPSAQAPGVDLTLCGSSAWSRVGARRLAIQSTANEFTEARELRVYGSAAQAASVLVRLRTLLTDCPVDGKAPDATANQEIAADTGSESVTFISTYVNGRPSGSITQVTQVGSAVLVTRESAELDASSATAAVPARTVVTQRIVPAMCVFTADGC